MHPVVAELCEQFFYGAPNRLGQLFPKEFKGVPKMAVVLVAMAISKTVPLYLIIWHIV